MKNPAQLCRRWSRGSSNLRSLEKLRKAQINVEGADNLYRELRIENTLTDAKGERVRLKPGAEVEVTIEAPPEATVPKR